MWYNTKTIAGKREISLVSFLEDLMRCRKLSASQFADDLGVSRVTVSRWLSGKDVPNTRSCLMLAEYSGVAVEEVFAIAGHLPRLTETKSVELPKFREYAREMYPLELDEDLIAMIEDLIERQRVRRCGREDS